MGNRKLGKVSARSSLAIGCPITQFIGKCLVCITYLLMVISKQSR